MNKTNITPLIIIIPLFIHCCTKQNPQIPHYLGQQPIDSSRIQRMRFNEEMAKQADLNIQQFLDSAHLQYKKMECGAWKTTIHTSNNNTIKQGDKVTLSINILSLERKHLSQMKTSCQVGKNDLPAAIRETLLNSQHLNQYELIVPWYAGYGVSGNKNVKPYQNIIINLKIL